MLMNIAVGAPNPFVSNAFSASQKFLFGKGVCVINFIEKVLVLEK